MPGAPVTHVRTRGTAVGVGQGAGVHHQVLVTAPGALDQDALTLKTYQQVSASVGDDVPLLGGPREPGLAPGLEQHRARQRPVLGQELQGDLRGPGAQGLVHAELGLGAPGPGVAAVHEGGTQPVVVGGGGDVDGAAHGPGPHQLTGLKGRLDVAAARARAACHQGVGHGGDLLALDGELAAHRLDGGGGGGGGHQPLGQYAGQAHVAQGDRHGCVLSRSVLWCGAGF